MKITRIWAMPCKWTFQIKPIKELLNKYVSDGESWVDPFAGYNSPATITNDLNPDAPTNYHMKAIDFSRTLSGTYDGCLFDPPYSLRQLKECYNQCGTDISYNDTIKFYSELKDELSSKIRTGGFCISFGWNTQGFGKKRGFEIVEILLVPHGGSHNDTLVTVEKKISKLTLKTTEDEQEDDCSE